MARDELPFLHEVHDANAEYTSDSLPKSAFLCRVHCYIGKQLM
jgi:hypothetical protein